MSFRIGIKQTSNFLTFAQWIRILFTLRRICKGIQVDFGLCQYICHLFQPPGDLVPLGLVRLRQAGTVETFAYAFRELWQQFRAWRIQSPSGRFVSNARLLARLNFTRVEFSYLRPSGSYRSGNWRYIKTDSAAAAWVALCCRGRYPDGFLQPADRKEHDALLPESIKTERKQLQDEIDEANTEVQTHLVFRQDCKRALEMFLRQKKISIGLARKTKIFRRYVLAIYFSVRDAYQPIVFSRPRENDYQSIFTTYPVSTADAFISDIRREILRLLFPQYDWRRGPLDLNYLVSKYKFTPAGLLKWKQDPSVILPPLLHQLGC